MLDHPEKTPRLLAALKAAAPFEVELAPSVIGHLQAENVANADRSPVVWDLSYAGDEGGTRPVHDAAVWLAVVGCRGSERINSVAF